MINMLKGTLQVAGFMLLSLGMDQLAAWLNIGIPAFSESLLYSYFSKPKSSAWSGSNLALIGRSPNCAVLYPSRSAS